MVFAEILEIPHSLEHTLWGLHKTVDDGGLSAASVGALRTKGVLVLMLAEFDGKTHNSQDSTLL